MITAIAVANGLRFLVLVLYGLTLGETAFIFKNYFKVAHATRRLLPFHITGVSLGLMMLETYVAIKTIGYFGDPFSWLTPYNLVALGLVYASLVAVRFHVSRKGSAHRKMKHEMPSLLEDPEFLP